MAKLTTINLTTFTADTSANNVTVTNTVTAQDFDTSSDYRLKENIVNTNDAMNMLSDLRVVSFNFKNNPEKTLAGFLAHELQEVVPSVVKGTKDGDNYQTVDMTKLVPYLVKALQEANDRITELEKWQQK